MLLETSISTSPGSILSAIPLYGRPENTMLHCLTVSGIGRALSDPFDLAE